MQDLSSLSKIPTKGLYRVQKQSMESFLKLFCMISLIFENQNKTKNKAKHNKFKKEY